ncbi:MAG: hypothetical protein ACWGSD_17715, partial [Thermodesulfobacteriota bacterium]
MSVREALNSGVRAFIQGPVKRIPERARSKQHTGARVQKSRNLGLSLSIACLEVASFQRSTSPSFPPPLT